MTWNKLDIQLARKIHLEPILKKRGYAIAPLKHNNYKLNDLPNLIVKHNFWCWKDKQLKGNAIDFFIHVEGRSFRETMEILIPKSKKG